jgi:hypothetical protein
MKETVYFIICILLSPEAFGQEYSLNKMTNGATITINYSVAAGELGSMHKAIFISKLGDSIQARHVIYNFGITISPNGLIHIKNNSFIPLEADRIKSFYDSNKDNFTVLKETWTLDST